MLLGARSSTGVSRSVAALAPAYAIASLLFVAGCPRSRGTDDAGSKASLAVAPSAVGAGAPRSGMVWIPSGVLRAGTPPGQAPRIADEELPGTDVTLGGFYIDVLPYPNESGAIATTNVTRDTAAELCEARGKRLCAELEWERACKGPRGTTYEYGDAYRSSICGTGVASEEASRRPTGERAACTSASGVREMHGGVWEWTSSDWGRGPRAKLAALRGGNAVAGELVGRCANAIARPPAAKGPTVGFRCCAGPLNDARVELEVRALPVLEPVRVTSTLALADAGLAALSRKTVHAWVWRPVPNEELWLRAECEGDVGPRHCEAIVARPLAGELQLLGRFSTGNHVPEFSRVGDANRLRASWLDYEGRSRQLRYAYGRVEIGEPAR